MLTDGSVQPEALDLLRTRCDLRILNGYPQEDLLVEACQDAVAILARLGVVTARVIEAAPRLRIIARHGAGSDGVDLAAATSCGIVVTTTGPANAGAVAEYTFALLLGLLRMIPTADHGMRAGSWNRTPLIGTALEGRTIGIVGLGEVGRRVARMAEGFGMQVLATLSRQGGTDTTAIPRLPLMELLSLSDIVSLHLRLAPSTAGIVNKRAIAAMRPGSVLVNTARGELIDEPALIAALRQGRLAGAAFDTYAVEPLPVDSPLRSMPNVLLSPHVAGQTLDAVRRVGLAAAQCILDELDGGRPAFVVNPEAYARRPQSVDASDPALR